MCSRVVTSRCVRVLLDYRSALRSRSGVGEYAHELVRALVGLSETPASGPPLELTIFSSSWKDRLQPDSSLSGIDAIDLRIPVAALNFAWHRLGRPSVERLTGRRFEVTHSLHPLLMPARAAARVVTIHDLHFMAHPERTQGEIRRDYRALAPTHARKADHVIVNSHYTAGEVIRQFSVPSEHVSVCAPGAPDWQPRAPVPGSGYLLFLGTLEPRKNIGTLLDAYERLLASRATGTTPDLVLAGQATGAAGPWLERLTRAPLAGHVRHLGYVDESKRRQVYEGARALVIPSFHEGFGIPVLEAMAIGVPVIAASSGALPEVLGDAGLLIDPQDSSAFATAMARLLDEDGLASHCAHAGVERARMFRWPETARRVCEAYARAYERFRAQAERH